uniref:G_PROTEIN_RECEP_F1_2 domain-containing protein n=1 Tax=Strongyloides papillosus TaxID=174720 RepID=A0A0N5BJD4_STREA
MTLSCQYIFLCSYHIFYNSFIVYHNFKKKSIFQHTCAKLNTIDMYINEIVILSLFFFNIFRYFKVIKQRLPNKFVMSVIVIILLFPPLYFVFGQVFELKLRYTKNMICIYGIASNLPLYKFFETENLIVLAILPLISFALNYYIFWKLKNIRNRHLVSKESFNESKHLFISITIQSIFPFICQVPTVIALLYYSFYQTMPLGLNILVQFLHYAGQGICIFLSLITINHFREMMKRDMLCKWTRN